MRVYLVRHGQTAWNSERRIQGHTDVSLDATGLLQAEALAGALRSARPERVLSSDLARAADTAAPVAEAFGLPLERTDQLRERRFGEWEGMAVAELTRRFIAHQRAEGVDRNELRAPGGGESYVDLWRRLEPIVEQLYRARRDVIVVSHGGTCSVMLAMLLIGTVASHRSFRFANAGITELYLRAEGQFQLVRYNDVRHVEALDHARPADRSASA